MDDYSRILWRKFKEFSRGEKRCCSVSYPAGYPVVDYSQLKKAVMGCKVAFVMFFGRNCPYCSAFDPIFRQVGERYGDLANFVKADVEIFFQIAASLDVMGTPTTVAFIEGQPIDAMYGFKPMPQFIKFVETTLSKAGCRAE